MQWRSTKIVVAVTTIALTGAALTGCSGSAPGSNSSGGGALTIGTGGVFTQNNNPFAPTSSSTANGWAWLIYEPLVQTNPTAPTAKPKPWLAKSYAWNKDYTEVKFTARDGVKWSDGKPFTADDIAFTFDMIRKDKALNTNNTPFTAVKKSGDTVTVDFGASQYVNASGITGQVIVPEHIWKSVKNPSTYADAKPIGTGPFTFSSSTSSVAKLKKNPTYWQAEKVKVGTVIYQALQGNDAIVNALAAHKVDWASSFALNQKSGFTDKSKQNIAWNVAALGISAFMVNTAKAPFDNVALRKAINLTIDRSKAAKLDSGGLLKPIMNVTGLPQPVGDKFIADTFKNQDAKVDVDGAKKVLAEAGFTLAGGTLTAPDGKPVTMTLIDPSGWTNYLTDLQVIGQDLKQIGIATTIQTPSQDAWNAAITSGNFDATMRYSDSGPTPYNIYATYMDGSKYAPIGQSANGDWSRFNNPDATAALKAYANATDDSARTAALKKIQQIWVDEVPAMATSANATTGMFTTVNFTGWPSEKNPYTSPGILDKNISVIMTTLTPSK